MLTPYFGGSDMWLKVYSSDVCPLCGRPGSTERISRTAWDRLLAPNTKKMKCRLCLHAFRVEKSRD